MLATRHKSLPNLATILSFMRRSLTKRHPVVLSTQFERMKPDRVADDGASSIDHYVPTRPRSAQFSGTGVGAHANFFCSKEKELAKGDHKLHVGGGNVMSYRWVARSVAKPNHGGNTLEAMDALSTSQEAMGLPIAQHEPFLLVAMPDLFMTLDSMERWLGGLLEHNNRGKLLLVSVFFCCNPCSVHASAYTCSCFYPSTRQELSRKVNAY